MKKFDELLNIAETLLGPGGCPWDQSQTFDTMKSYVLEETHELLEAIDLHEESKIKEEWGDCLYTLIFLAKLAEKQKIFSLQEALSAVADKLIRRHPHIFSGVSVESAEDVVRNWEEIKKKEGKKSPIDGIPPTLPALARCQKVIRKLRQKQRDMSHLPPCSEEELETKLWEWVERAETSGLDAESALRRFCLKREQSFTIPSTK